MSKHLPFDPLEYFPIEVKDTLFESCKDTWIMHEAERVMILSMLRNLKPEVAIDCGTAHGGSLSAIAKYAKKVYTLDYDPTCKERFGKEFPNAEFISGDINETLPKLMEQINKKGENLEFILLDAQHSRQGICKEINSILKYKPQKHLFIIIHDSFIPECREGIKEANWKDCPWVHFIELDFVSGVYGYQCKNDRKMTCGLAFVLLRAIPRQGSITFHEKNRGNFENLYPISIHANTLRNRIRGKLSRWKRF